MARRRLLLSLPAWPVLLTACIDDGGPPRIDSFAASSTRVAPGATVSLLAQFEDGAGVIDQGVGPVRSGVPIEVTPDGETVYTLTVRNGSGEVTSQVGVQPGLLRSWDFAVDTPETWGDPNVTITNGQLVLIPTDPEVPGECGFGSGTRRLESDELWLSGAGGALRMTAVLSGFGYVTIWYGELFVEVRFDTAGRFDTVLVIDLLETGKPIVTLDGVQFDGLRVGYRRLPGVRGGEITFSTHVECWQDHYVGHSVSVRTLRFESI